MMATKYFVFALYLIINCATQVNGQGNSFVFHDRKTPEEFIADRNIEGFQSSFHSNFTWEKLIEETTNNNQTPDIAEKTLDEIHHSSSPTSYEDETAASVLSFNFLYYIIQRFKFSDVIH